MIIKKIEVKNFRAFQNEVFNFADDRVNFIVGKPGAGKTSLYLAVLWCLGVEPSCCHTPNDVNAREATKLNDGGTTIIEVSVTFYDKEFKYINICRKEEFMKVGNNFQKIQRHIDIKKSRDDGKTFRPIILDSEQHQIIDKIVKSILYVNDGIVSEFSFMLSGRYGISKDTSYNLLEMLLVRASDIYNKMWNEENSIIQLNRDLRDFVLLKEGVPISTCGNGKQMIIISILMAILNFDNEIIVFYDGMFIFDEKELSLFIENIAKIDRQAFFVAYEFLEKSFKEKYVPYGYCIDKIPDGLSAEVLDIKEIYEYYNR